MHQDPELKLLEYEPFEIRDRLLTETYILSTLNYA